MRNNHFDALYDFMAKEFVKDGLKDTFVSFVAFFFVVEVEVEVEDRY